MGRVVALLAVCLVLGSGCSLQPPTAPAPTPKEVPFPALAGEYRTATGVTYVVNALGHMVRLADGWIRQLYPTERRGRFVYGPGFEVSTPAQGQVDFHLDGQRAGSLTVDDVPATRLAFKETDVRIPAAGGVELAATITEPLTPGPHPGIAVVHGSEAGTRALYGVWAGLYAGLGMAVLTYDKRGNGESGGTFPGDNSHPQTLSILAADAAACAKFLASWPGIDPKRVGFHGGSQGGWTVPLAIRQFPHAAFAVLLSGPAVSVGQQTVWSLASGDASYEPTTPAAEIDAQMRKAAGTGYQPRPALLAMTQPALWMNGANDRRVPTQLTMEVLRSMHKQNFETYVLPGVGHGLLENATGLDQDDARARWLAPELFTRIAAWLARHVGASPTVLAALDYWPTNEPPSAR